MDTQNHSRAVETARAEPGRIDFDDYASYEEGDFRVICDRENANAWFKSDVSVAVEE